VDKPAYTPVLSCKLATHRNNILGVRLMFPRMVSMLRSYDIFEKFPDGSFAWRACVEGRFNTERKLQELTEHSDNEFFLVDTRTTDVLPFSPARSNSRKQIERRDKQIA
jgi:hypothetical protein